MPHARKQERKPWADKLPGSYKSFVPEAWYAFRLGLIDAHGSAIHSRRTEAVRWFIGEFVDPISDDAGDSPALAAFYRQTQRVEQPGNPKRYEPDEWSWAPPTRHGFNPETKKARWDSRMAIRHLYGHWWRGLVTDRLRRLGAGDSPDFGSYGTAALPLWAMEVNSALRRGDEHLRDAVLGTDYAGTPSERLLMLPPADHWWWVARSIDGVRAIVVDLDSHNDADREHFAARLRVLTCPGMPKPHLIVTSKSNGRHLWYLLDQRARSRPWGLGMKAGLLAVPFRDRLRALGIHVAPGAIEVFPSGSNPTDKLPPVPFGDRSYLCDADGSRTRFTSVAAITRLHRLLDGSVTRYSLDAFETATTDGATAADLALVATPPPSSLVKRLSSRVKTHDDPPVRYRRPRRLSRLDHQRAASAAATTTRRADSATIEDARRLYEEGADDDTNAKTGIITRYIKHHLPRRAARADENTPDGTDWAAFRRWIASHPKRGNPAEASHQDGRFRCYFPNAAPLARGAPPSPALCAADIRHIAAETTRLSPDWQDTRRRAGLVIVFAYALGLARASEPTGNGSVTFPLPTARLQSTWRDGYRAYLDRLCAEGGALERVTTGNIVASRDGRLHGTTGTYRTQLPQTEGEPAPIAGPQGLTALIERHLSCDGIRALFPRATLAVGTRYDWRKAFARTPARVAAPRRALVINERGHYEFDGE